MFGVACLLIEFHPPFLNVLSYWYVGFYKLGFDLLLTGLVVSFAYSFLDSLKNINPKNDYSYGIYIYHMVVINTFLSLHLTSQLWLFAALLITTLLAVISWHKVEKPFLKLKNNHKI